MATIPINEKASTPIQTRLRISLSSSVPGSPTGAVALAAAGLRDGPETRRG
jgi:hypothetical protein